MKIQELIEYVYIYRILVLLQGKPIVLTYELFSSMQCYRTQMKFNQKSYSLFTLLHTSCNVTFKCAFAGDDRDLFLSTRESAPFYGDMRKLQRHCQWLFNSNNKAYSRSIKNCVNCTTLDKDWPLCSLHSPPDLFAHKHTTQVYIGPRVRTEE